MGSSKSKRIIESYLQVLRTAGDLLAFGVPESLLADPRERIQQAFRDLGPGLSGLAVGLDDLRAAYQSLASFLPYEDANAVACLHHAVARGDYAFLATATAHTATAITRRIEQEAGRLAREFDALLCGPADPLLAEVDAFLSQIEEKQKPLTG